MSEPIPWWQERVEGLTVPFWAAGAAGVLVRPVCDACGRSFFTPSWCCPYCLSEAWTYRPSSGEGVVYSHTTVHRPPEPAFEAPFVLAVVDMAEGWSMLTRLLVEPPQSSLIGAPVQVAFTPDPVVAGRRLPTFALVDTP